MKNNLKNEKQDSRVRVRFAPSPTGPLHIGGVRTALYNYLFAKKHGGDFILRIEDTDQNRYVEGAEAYIIEALNWCGIPFDEGPSATLRTGIGKEGAFAPYRQSERKHLYRKYADTLITDGKAYYAFDTAEELDFHRKDHEEKGKTFIYNHHNRLKLKNSLSLPADEVQKRINSGEEYVIRFKSPESRILILNDIIRGEITIDTSILDDKVLFKSDGMPTYHLANIVDDHLMKISHVIRGEEWLPSLALHVLLYEAFGWEAPQFAHLPLLMKPEGKGKLSKRDGDKMGFPVFPLEWKDPKTGEISRGYREDGYFPEAVINILAFLGWNPGTEQEIFSLKELTAAFDLERVHKAGAKFDPEKAKWFQHHYLQQKSDAALASDFQKLLEEKGIKSSLNLERIVALIKERSTFIHDFWEQSSFFFATPQTYDEKTVSKIRKPDTPQLIQQAVVLIENVSEFKEAELAAVVKAWITENNIGFGKVMQPLRLALVGDMKGPDVFAIMDIIGKEETLKRISRLWIES